jgi:selenocysteine lyase/cysteine desulfurase
MEAPLAKSAFAGIENVAHLAAGGETPALSSHGAALARFLADKSASMKGRERMFATVATLKSDLGRLLGVTPADIALLASASEGLFVAARGIDWRPGDNVVVALSEFPSVLHAWRAIDGIEIRILGESIAPKIEEIRAATDGRTRAIAASQVSYLTGARLDLARLREAADAVGARLIVDASHALGVVEVAAEHCDVVVSCSYKWMLGTHGVGVFYVNGKRWPELQAPWLGWHSIDLEDDWRQRSTARSKSSIERFEIGNYPFLASYVLQNGVSHLLAVGIPAIERHVHGLGGALIRELQKLNLPVLTPTDPAARGGNVAFATDRSEALEAYLRERGVLSWSGDRRLRLSVHGYNDEGDVAKAIDALRGAGV